MDQDSDEYASAQNEDLGRRINERINRRAIPGSGDNIWVVCECSNGDCEERIQMSLEDYESVRQADSCFIVCVGHESPELERVVGRGDSWLTVEKTGNAKRITRELEER